MIGLGGVGSAILPVTMPVGLSTKESRRELRAVDGAGDSRPPKRCSGVDVADGSAFKPR